MSFFRKAFGELRMDVPGQGCDGSRGKRRQVCSPNEQRLRSR